MKRWVGAAVLGAMAGTVACGGNVTVGAGGTTGGSGGASTTSSTTHTGGASTTSSTTHTGGTGGTGGGLAAGQCHTDADCTPGFDECLQPGGFAGCGICNPTPTDCAADADCKAQGTTWICDPVVCGCMGQTSCRPGCTSDATCSTGETCTPGGRCLPKPCSAASDCPVDFTCNAGGCQRTPCSSDAQCQGYCVKDACYDMPGTCVPIPA